MDGVDEWPALCSAMTGAPLSPPPRTEALLAHNILRRGAREQQIGGSGGSLEPLGLFLEPLGLFLRTSIPFIRRILSAFLRA